MLQKGFKRKASSPKACALSACMVWLKPLHKIMGSFRYLYKFIKAGEMAFTHAFTGVVLCHILIESKRTVLVWTTGYVNSAIVMAHNALDDREPHARTFVWGLSGEKWIKNAVQDLDRYS